MRNRRSFTAADMIHHAGEAWGDRGVAIVERWRAYNDKYFGGRLRPVPLILTHTQPFGRRIAFCSHSTAGGGRTITLNLPGQHDVLVADAATLLHEMIHQLLFEQDEDPSHAGDPWRREIMRLQLQLTGREIWAGRSKTIRDPHNKKRVIRINEDAADGRPSISQAQIARWPHDGMGIKLGPL